MSATLKVLVIDDEPEIVESLVFLLEKQGFQVTGASQGKEAFTRLQGEKFDGVVCDFLMPKMDGISLLKLVREGKDYTPFVFLSGNASDEEEVKLAGLGVYHLLPKTQILSVGSVLKEFIQRQKEVKDMGTCESEDSKDFLAMLHSAR